MTTQRAVATRPAQAIEPDAVGKSLLLSLTHEQLEVIRKAIAPGITDVELELFLRVAQENQLSPWTSPPEIWAVPRRSQVNGQWVTKYTPTMGIDGWRKLLQRTGRVLDSVIEWCGMDGQWRDVWLDDKLPPAAARASIYVKGWDRPQRFVCKFSEYAQYKDGGLTAMWKDKPSHMIGVRALSHCAKEVLRAVGGYQVGDVELGDWEPNEIAPERVAQRRFWAIATDLGYDDATVRRAFHVGDQESLSEAIDRLGGWGKAQSYIEAWGDSVPSLPEPAQEPVNDLLYEREPAPVDERTPMPAHKVIESLSRQPAVDVATGEILDEPPPPDDDAYLGICSAEGCRLPATGFGPDAEPLCDVHLHGEESAQPEARLAEPSALPEMPDGIKNAGEFLTAAFTAFQVTPTRLEAYFPGWRKTPPAEYAELWAKLAAQMAA